MVRPHTTGRNKWRAEIVLTIDGKDVKLPDGFDRAAKDDEEIDESITTRELVGQVTFKGRDHCLVAGSVFVPFELLPTTVRVKPNTTVLSVKAVRSKGFFRWRATEASLHNEEKTSPCSTPSSSARASLASTGSAPQSRRGSNDSSSSLSKSARRRKTPPVSNDQRPQKGTRDNQQPVPQQQGIVEKQARVDHARAASPHSMATSNQLSNQFVVQMPTLMPMYVPGCQPGVQPYGMPMMMSYTQPWQYVPMSYHGMQQFQAQSFTSNVIHVGPTFCIISPDVMVPFSVLSQRSTVEVIHKLTPGAVVWASVVPSESKSRSWSYVAVDAQVVSVLTAEEPVGAEM